VVKLPGVPKRFVTGYLVPTNDLAGRPVHYRGQGFALDGPAGELLQRSAGVITMSRAMAVELFALTAQRVAGEVI